MAQQKSSVQLPHIPASLTKVDELQDDLLQDEKLIGSKAADQSIQNVAINALELEECLLTRIDFTDTKFHRLNAVNVIFEKGMLFGSDWYDATLRVCSFNHCRASAWQLNNSLLKDVTLSDCKIDSFNLRYAKLRSVTFRRCVIADLDMAHVHAQSVVFEDCKIERIELSHAQLQDVDIRTSELRKIQGIEGLKGVIISPEQLYDLAPILAGSLGIRIE